MEYINAEYQGGIALQTGAAKSLSACRKPFENLDLGKFNSAAIDIILSHQWYSEFLKQFESKIRAEISNSGIKLQSLQNSLMSDSILEFKEKLELLKAARGMPLERAGSFLAKDFEIKGEEVAFLESWRVNLLKECTTTPTTTNQKKFAKLVADFQHTFEELNKLLPAGVPVIEEMGPNNKGLFTLVGGREIRNTDTSLLKRVG